MRKKEKEIMNITLWRMGRRYIRNGISKKYKANKEYSEGFQDGFYACMSSLAMTLNVNLTELLRDIQDGKEFEDININSKICK